VYVGDYLYVVAGDELVVADETDWSRATTVDRSFLVLQPSVRNRVVLGHNNGVPVTI